jgi:hypothetical protein
LSGDFCIRMHDDFVCFTTSRKLLIK